jgi:uncharacterized protein YndB with AHSA1/START domain
MASAIASRVVRIIGPLLVPECRPWRAPDGASAHHLLVSARGAPEGRRQMADYSFVTVWRLDAPIDRVYEAIRDSLAWPTWWDAVKAVEEREAGDASTGIGSVRRYTFKGSLPYTLSFDLHAEVVEPPHRLAGRAAGELAGTGVWTLTEADGRTVVRYDWNVRTTRWWMNLLAPLAGGVFKANHDVVMRSGARGICALLGGVNGTCEWVQDREPAPASG